MKPQVIETMSWTVETVQPYDSLDDAYHKMTGFRHLPVLDEESNIVGIISDRDFQRAIVKDRIASPMKSVKPKFKPGATVADYMSWPVVSVSSKSPFLKVVETMIADKVSAVLVIDDNELVGIVTHEDLLRVLADLLKQNRSFKEQIFEKINDWAYNSPIGQIVHLLSEAGI
jgi:predicted transcriptional regulator